MKVALQNTSYYKCDKEWLKIQDIDDHE